MELNDKVEVKKVYRLLTPVSGYEVGTIFTLAEKHKLMASLPWQMTRSVLFEIIELWN